MIHQRLTIFANRVLLGFALLQLLIAGTVLIAPIEIPGHSSWSIVSPMIAGAFVMIFCAHATVNDERVELLKMKAGKVGLLLGTIIAMFTYLISAMLGGSMPLSAFDVLIIVMLIALGCFYFWRWQDSRPVV